MKINSSWKGRTITKKIVIIKADGRKAFFNPNKIIRTCRRAGANKAAGNRIVKKVRRQIYPGIKTRDIYKMVLSALDEETHGRALKQRYQLKDAIMRLGKSGFMFEDYIGDILKNSGFEIKHVRKKIKGKCTVHEIDLIVTFENKKTLVECKYHSKHGVYTGLKESLYTHARFLDTVSYFNDEYLICNTKVSQQAKKYAKCIDQHILSWRYPPNNSLEKIIERNHLYPITILNLHSGELESFSKHRIMLAKKLLDYTEHQLSKKMGINLKRIRNLQKLTREVIS